MLGAPSGLAPARSHRRHSMQATEIWPEVRGLSRVLARTLVPHTASCYPQAGTIGGLFPPHHNLGLLERLTAATCGARLAGVSPGHGAGSLARASQSPSRDPPVAPRRISVGAARSIGDTKSLTPDDANRPGPRGGFTCLDLRYRGPRPRHQVRASEFSMTPARSRRSGFVRCRKMAKAHAERRRREAAKRRTGRRAVAAFGRRPRRHRNGSRHRRRE